VKFKVFYSAFMLYLFMPNFKTFIVFLLFHFNDQIIVSYIIDFISLSIYFALEVSV